MRNIKELSEVIESRLMFKTVKGSKYYREPNGFWRRKKFDGTTYTRYVYLGSINPQLNCAVTQDYYNEREIANQLIRGRIDGFTPRFVVGFQPFGIIGCNPDDFIYQKGILVRRKPLKVYTHIGHSIAKIHSK